MQISELVSHVDFTPTLLTAAGLPVPDTMQGHSFLPLLDRRTEGWRNEVFFEMSEFVTGTRPAHPAVHLRRRRAQGPRMAVRCVGAQKYVEYMLYDLNSDPYQQVNLAGRAPYHKTAAELRQRLLGRMREASGEHATIEPAWFPYS